jgi:hypothetical protein
MDTARSPKQLNMKQARDFSKAFYYLTMRAPILTITGILLGLTFFSCEKNAATPQVVSGNCNTTNITYKNTMQSIISYDCAYSKGCHAAGSIYPDFSTYAGLKYYADNGQLYEQLFISRRMPPSPQPLLDNCTLNQINAWINTGTPQ